MTSFLKHLPFLKGVYQEEIKLEHPFEQVAQAFASQKGTVLLLSGSDLDASRYHILAVDPWLELSGRQKLIQIDCLGQRLRFEQDVFSVLEVLSGRFKLPARITDLPVCAGLFGYFSYDLKNQIETLPSTCMDVNLPDLVLYAPSIIIVHDKKSSQTTLSIPLPDRDRSEKEIIEQKRRFFFERIHKFVQHDYMPGRFFIDSQGLGSGFTKDEYIQAVKQIITHLKAGDIYQANLSQRFETGFSGDAYALFLDLYDRNPAAFFSYIHAGDHRIVSTSPERFIKQSGRLVETRPIKGTIARGSSEEQDLKNRNDLSSSFKDDAELTMIVDLMRNDLSRVTRHESVVVKEHKRIEAYDNVFHLVSIVHGELEPDKTSVDLLKATFPGGSITGCPKIRSMEIIDELEPVKRHVYTGSIGYISFHDTMDLSIAIRTATIVNNTVFFSVGGGIVYDSDPEKEFQETLDKGKTLIESLCGSEAIKEKPKIKAWVDGKIVEQDKVMVPASSSGFQYGAGLFETIRVENGYAFRLADHVNRLNRSWTALFSSPVPDITWENVIQQLIRKNQFADKTLAVKLLVSKDERDNGKQVFLAAFAREYVHRLDLAGKKGLDLITYPYPRQTPLADHKTLNYLYYDQAGRYAKANGADEALILNADHTVSETNTANIFSIQEKEIIVPESAHVLCGVTLAAALAHLSQQGYRICKTPVSKEEFCSCSNILLTNALMGAVKVLTIDGKSIKQEQGICSIINKALFQHTKLNKQER